MAESTLQAQWSDLLGDVGFFLGFGRGALNGEEAWTTQRQATIDRCVKGGLRNFYHCGYDWSFLKPIASLTLAQGANVIKLPDDYGSKEGQITLAITGGCQWWPIEFQGIGRVYQKQAELPTTTGRPQLCAEEPIKGTSATQGQRMQLRFWPIADQAYTLQFAYYLLPDYLNGAFPFAYGGAQHAETLLESCLAVAEKLLDDAATTHAMEFEKRLAVSMDIDRRNKPQTLGYNRDLSDLRNRRFGPGGDMWRSWSPITYKGVQY